MLTAMAFEYFARSRPDIVVLEVGMGGRLDATNVVEPRLSIITDISLDHQNYLGDTIRQITGEKAGIIRPGGDSGHVAAIARCERRDWKCDSRRRRDGGKCCPVCAAGFAGQRTVGGERRPVAKISARGTGAEIMVESPLVGRHQLRNVALAIAAAVELRGQGLTQITPETIAQGIRGTRWPGRFEVIQGAGENPEYVLDVAHNPAGAWALRSTLSAVYRDTREITLVFGVMRDKAVQEMTEILFPIATHVIVTHANNPRAASADEIRLAAARASAGTEIETAADLAMALERARAAAGRAGLVVITGSIYVVGEAMRILDVRI